MRTYNHSFKRKMVQRLLLANGPSQVALAAEVGIPQTTLSSWVRQFGTLDAVAKNKTTNVAPKPRRPEDWSPEDRLRVLMEASAVGDAGLGELLRREGLHEESLQEWRKAALEALRGGAATRASGVERKKIKQLERELERKNAALAEAAALLVLKKKVQAIWGDEDDDTSGRNDK